MVRIWNVEAGQGRAEFPGGAEGREETVPLRLADGAFPRRQDAGRGLRQRRIPEELGELRRRAASRSTLGRGHRREKHTLDGIATTFSTWRFRRMADCSSRPARSPLRSSFGTRPPGSESPLCPTGCRSEPVPSPFRAMAASLATALPGGAIQLWEVATWTKRNEFKGHRDRPTALTFAPGGQLLSGSVDTTVLAWDIRPPRVAAIRDRSKRPGTTWPNGKPANRSNPRGDSWRRRRRRSSSSPKRLNPWRPLIPSGLRRLLADLGSDVFAVREAASKALHGLDEQAIPYLEETLKSTESAEVRVRVKRILEQKPRAALTPEQLRQIRAVMVLERIGDGAVEKLVEAVGRRSGGGTVDQGSFRGSEAAGSSVESESLEQCSSVLPRGEGVAAPTCPVSVSHETETAQDGCCKRCKAS